MTFKPFKNLTWRWGMLFLLVYFFAHDGPMALYLWLYFRFHSWVATVATGFQWLSGKITDGHLVKLTKGLASILRIVDARNFATVDPEMTFAPGSDINLKLFVAYRCMKFLHGGTLANGELLIGFPTDLGCGYIRSLQERKTRMAEGLAHKLPPEHGWD